MATSAVVSNSEETLAIRSEIGYTENGKHTAYTKDADGRQTSYAYDSLDRLSSVTAPNGTTTSYTYVSALDNRISEVETSASTASVSYTYDGARMDSLTFGNDTFTFEVDQFGNTLSTLVNDLALSTNTYGANNGPLQQVTYGNGDVRTYTYNWLGQVSAIGNSTSNQYTWQYDDNGAQIGFTDLVAARKFLYTRDSLNRLVRQQILSTSGTTLGGLEYDYDIRNNVTRFVLNMGGYTTTQQYLYEAVSDRPETEDFAKDNLPTRYIINGDRYVDYTYDSLNRLTSRLLDTPRLIITNYSYVDSALGTVDGVTYQTTKLHTEIIDNTAYRYTYDTAGNIIKIEKGSRFSSTNTATDFAEYLSYEYDSLGQLTRVNSVPENKTTIYRYDDCGNIRETREYFYQTTDTATIWSSDTPERVTTYQYGGPTTGFYTLLLERTIDDVRNNTVETETYAYDEIGNPLTFEGATLTWQNGRQLATYTKGDISVSYTYDSDGLRTSKIVNGVKHEYLYEGNKLVYEKRGDDHLYFFYDSYGHLAALRYHTGNAQYIFYAITNAQGDVLRLYGADGNIVALYEYDAWGNVVSIVDTTASGYGIATVNPIRYRGYYFDEETNWYYLQSRYYDPEVGRFINADSQLNISEGITGYNTYQYCGNNPVCRIDSTGKAWWHWALGAVVVVGCAVATVVTCGGFAAAAGAVAAVGCGVAAATPAATITAGMFIGSATVYGMSVLSAASSSDTIDEFYDQGNWQTVTDTIGGGLLGGASAAFLPPNTSYPPNNGFNSSPRESVLAPGSQLQRVGDTSGSFVAPINTPLPTLSLPPDKMGAQVITLEVVTPIVVQAGTAMPWFGQPGGGTQFLLAKTIVELIAEGALKIIS